MKADNIIHSLLMLFKRKANLFQSFHVPVIYENEFKTYSIHFICHTEHNDENLWK